MRSDGRGGYCKPNTNTQRQAHTAYTCTQNMHTTYKHPHTQVTGTQTHKHASTNALALALIRQPLTNLTHTFSHMFIAARISFTVCKGVCVIMINHVLMMS